MHLRRALVAVLTSVTLVLTGSSLAQANDSLLHAIGNNNPSQANGSYWIKSHEVVGQRFMHSTPQTITSLDFLCGPGGNFSPQGVPIATTTSVQVTFWDGIPGTPGVSGNGAAGVWNFASADFCDSSNPATRLSGSPVTLKAGSSYVSFAFGEMGSWSLGGTSYPTYMTAPVVSDGSSSNGMTYSFQKGVWDFGGGRSLSLRLYGSEPLPPKPEPEPAGLTEAEAEARAKEVIAECAESSDCGRWNFLVNAIGGSSLVPAATRQCMVSYLIDYGPSVVSDADLGQYAVNMQYTTGVATDMLNWIHQQMVVGRLASIPFPSAFNPYDTSSWSNLTNRSWFRDTILAGQFQKTLNGISNPFQGVGLPISAATEMPFIKSSLLLNDNSFNC